MYYKTLSPRCKSDTYSMLFSAINLIYCQNVSITYLFLTYIWGVIRQWRVLGVRATPKGFQDFSTHITV